MKKLIKYFLVFSTTVVFSQENFPTEKYFQFNIDVKHNYSENYINLEIKNTNKAAVRLNVFTDNEILNSKYKINDTILITPLASKFIKYYIPNTEKFNYYFNTNLGDPDKQIIENKLTLPFPKGKKYVVTQGYRDTLSHNTLYNMYALDFNLQVNDTITSADYGIVVGLVKDYKYGGASKVWKENDRSNYITIYHPHSGLYTQYGHLVFNGSLVKIGDRIERGQAIGLSGNTGFSTGPHLHFNVLVPKKGLGLVSIPAVFEGDIHGEDLKIGTTVSR